jgi:lysophospholipase L1-like esterase
VKIPNSGVIPRAVGTTLIAAACLAAHSSDARPTTGEWEQEVQAFEAADRAHPPPANAVLFLGSSSIRLWKTLEADFPGLRVINRGFGGSHLADSVALADRLVLPCKPRMIVVYAGDNDIASGKSPAEVSGDFDRLVNKLHRSLPSARIAFISIKPSPSRWKFVEQIKSANRQIQEACRKDNRLIYIDVFSRMLGPDGMPNEDLFVDDKLHLNARGYALWTALVRPHLEP